MLKFLKCLLLGHEWEELEHKVIHYYDIVDDVREYTSDELKILYKCKRCGELKIKTIKV